MRKDLQSAISGPFGELARVIKGFDPNQPRDGGGKWTSAGGDTSKDNFLDEDHDFVEEHGEAFVPAINHLYTEFGISGSAALDIQAEINAETPEELVAFIQDNYVGIYEDEGDEAVANDWLKDTGVADTLPKVVKDNLDMRNLAFDLIQKEGPLMSVYDSHEEQYHILKRPKKG